MLGKSLLEEKKEMSVKATKPNFLESFKTWIVKEKEETVILLRSIPATVVSLFVVSVICMNLLANKTLTVSKMTSVGTGANVLSITVSVA